MTKSARSKGLDFVREVRKILEGMGHIVEGPGYGVAFYNAKMNPVHKDFFGVFDLISFDGKSYVGHQVSTETNKSTKIKAIQEAKLPGWVWCRSTDDDGFVGYAVYEIKESTITEHEMVYGIRRKIKKGRPIPPILPILQLPAHPGKLFPGVGP